MAAPRHFIAPIDCEQCELRHRGDFCHLPSHLLGLFAAMGHVTLYPAYSVLVREGQMPQGIYILCSGRAKLSVEARDGKTVILKIADERYVLALSAVLSGRPSPMSVTTVDFCQIKFIERTMFLHLVESDNQVALACASMLAREASETFDDVHELLLARSSTEKLARLLLSWVAGEPRNRELRVSAEFTHEEIAQMIGSSRETVTRLLSDMRKRELIRIEGSTLVIPNRVALQAIT